MKLLIDINHPAHVHLFKGFAKEMIKRGHIVLFICREKEFEKKLLTSYGFDFISLGKHKQSLFNKIWGILKNGYKEYLIAKRFKPDFLLSHGSHNLAHAAFLIRKPHIAFEDTFNKEQMWLYVPFSDVIFTSNYPHPFVSNKEIHYAGYHELAYLHPKRFTPNKDILNELHVHEGDKYVILRFVSWKASHDIGHRGISYENKIKAVKEFSKFAKVFISSEAELPNELQDYKINISPEKIHDALAFASLIFGESFTIPAEGSILGTPSIIVHNTTSYYLKEQQDKYGLCYCYPESEEGQCNAIAKGIELLKMDNLNAEYIKRHEKLLSDKIDVTAFLVWFIEDYPNSKKIMKDDPNYQYKFK